MTEALALPYENLTRYMAEICRYAVLSRQEEQKLARLYLKSGDVQAAHRLVVSNLRFVVKIAYEYRRYGMKLLDLIQEGNIGLMIAVKKFDPDKGYRLISYAIWWIRAYMHGFIMRSWSLVRLGASRVQRKLFFRLRSAKGKHADHPASTSEIAQALGVEESDVIDMEVRLAAHDFSLDSQLTDETHTTHLDRLTDDASISPEDSLALWEEKRHLQRKINKAKKKLKERERYILENRLMSEEPETLREIGSKFNLSRERVRQLESRLIDKLRGALGDCTPTAA